HRDAASVARHGHGDGCLSRAGTAAAGEQPEEWRSDRTDQPARAGDECLSVAVTPRTLRGGSECCLWSMLNAVAEGSLACHVARLPPPPLPPLPPDRPGALPLPLPLPPRSVRPRRMPSLLPVSPQKPRLPPTSRPLPTSTRCGRSLSPVVPAT